MAIAAGLWTAACGIGAGVPDGGVPAGPVACSGDGDCPAPGSQFCNGSAADAGTCAQKLPTGTACMRDAECVTHHCLQAQQGLRCATVAVCDGPCRVVNATGEACAGATDGSNPKGLCNPDQTTCTAYGCGASGACNGLGTGVCQVASCSDATNTFTALRTCDGRAGVCPDNGSTWCATYRCSVTDYNGCFPTAASCLGDFDCADNAWCQTAYTSGGKDSCVFEVLGSCDPARCVVPGCHQCQSPVSNNHVCPMSGTCSS